MYTHMIKDRRTHTHLGCEHFGGARGGAAEPQRGEVLAAGGGEEGPKDPAREVGGPLDGAAGVVRVADGGVGKGVVGEWLAGGGWRNTSRPREK